MQRTTRIWKRTPWWNYEQCRACKIERAENKKFAKENKKLVRTRRGKAAHDKDGHRARLSTTKDEFARLEKERGSEMAMLKRDKPPEKK